MEMVFTKKCIKSWTWRQLLLSPAPPWAPFIITNPFGMPAFFKRLKRRENMVARLSGSAIITLFPVAKHLNNCATFHPPVKSASIKTLPRGWKLRRFSSPVGPGKVWGVIKLCALRRISAQLSRTGFGNESGVIVLSAALNMKNRSLSIQSFCARSIFLKSILIGLFATPKRLMSWEWLTLNPFVSGPLRIVLQPFILQWV